MSYNRMSYLFLLGQFKWKKKNEITGEMNKKSFMDLGMKMVIQFSLSKLNTE